MTRLIHLAGYTPPQTGSFVPFLHSVLGLARQRGWEVEAVFPAEARERPWVSGLLESGIGVSFASGSRSELRRWLDSRLDESSGPTILHTHFTVYDVAAALAARRRRDVVVYWHVHSVLSRRPAAVAANVAKFTLLGRWVDRILSPADDVAAEVRRRRLGDQGGKVSVLPSSIDPAAFPLLEPEQRSGFRQRLGIPEGREVLLHFGRDWQLKDGDVFLDAVAVLASQGRDVLALVNQGGEDARSAARARGIEDRLHPVGMLPEANPLYGAADVLIASSRGEAMPFTVVEALCSGTPVVASDLAGHRFLGDELAACTIAPRDGARIAADAAAFLDMDPGRRHAECEAARLWIEQRLDVRVAARMLLEQYDRTLADRGLDSGAAAGSATQPSLG
jgi:glycosyltransferase involved in cell wall biosynthesis